MAKVNHKIILYQVLPRLFGNTKTDWVPWGTREQNGTGKLADFTDRAILAIKDLGITHIWLTGILHHALIGDYKSYGISDDDPDVVKGRAGSPYAIKDYYSVNPDLAIDPAKRNEEFKALVERIHAHELKVIIDLVPNHVARKYESVLKPDGTLDFGEKDDASVEYDRDNNFYYIPGKAFEVPVFPEGYKPLGGEEHPLADGIFEEFPAKWTGNGSRNAQPDHTDWYETVKLNYGVKPDGTWDFDPVPDEMRHKNPADHTAFWDNRSVPDTWKKMKEIALFWLNQGVDGFRFDMAEMVPVPFWSYLNAHIKSNKPEAITVAEIYEPVKYNDYIQLGLMDLLYDKVDLYDTLRDIICGRKDCHHIFNTFDKHFHISEHLIHFLENHDEHRIASKDFAGDPFRALPAMVISATIGKGALMMYNGQEVGEPADQNAGFGSSGRTSIFDYIGIPMHQKWMNDGAFNENKLENWQVDLRNYYKKLLNFSKYNPALQGHYYDLHRHNAERSNTYPGNDVYSFARYANREKLLILCNFNKLNNYNFRFYIYYDLIKIWGLVEGAYHFIDLFTKEEFTLFVTAEEAYFDINIGPLSSLILQKSIPDEVF